MISLFRSIFRASNRIFPNSNSRILLFILTSLGALVSISELGIAKIFTEIVVGGKRTSMGPITLLIVFLLLSLVARLSHYYQRTQRIKVFGKAILATNLRHKENSWNYSLAMEISNIYSHLLQLFIVSIFLCSLSIFVGVTTITGIILILRFQGRLFAKQEEFQRQALRSKFSTEVMPVETKLFVRIRGGEIGALTSGVVSIALLMLLIFAHHETLISSSAAIISFFGIRLMGNNCNSLASAFMRFARALVNSSVSPIKVTKSSSRAESVEEWDEN